ELDLGHGKLNLFSQEHCSGKVVYWTPSWAMAPMTYQSTGIYTIKMLLDGQPVDVAFDLNYPRSTIGLSLARSLFHLDSGSPGMKRLRDTAGHDLGFRYAFKTLASSSLNIGNPVIDIYDDEA